jgi:hypothetical protein
MGSNTVPFVGRSIIIMDFETRTNSELTLNVLEQSPKLIEYYSTLT